MAHSSLRHSLALAAALGCAGVAQAQSYPAKPLRVIVPVAPGGGLDFVTRLLGPRLADALGQQIIVENRPGGGSTIGTDYALRAAPDGYTLLMISPSYSINPSLYPIKFDPVADFTPLVEVARNPYVIAVHPSLPARTTREVIALAKTRPAQITYGSSGQGTIVHLTTELFLHMAGVKMTHVPYKGGGPALQDLIAGHIQLVFATSQTSLPQVKAGRLRALAVTTPERIAAEPSLPTVSESGVPGYAVTNWLALIGPKGLPRVIVDRWNGETVKILKQKEFEDRLQAAGVSAAGGTPEQLYDQVRREIEQWRKVVERAGIKIH